jgi:hypothetical protein
MENLDSDLLNQLAEELKKRNEAPQQLSAAELRQLRQIILADARASWLRKQLKVLVPWIFAVVSGLYGAWHVVSELMKHSR